MHKRPQRHAKVFARLWHKFAGEDSPDLPPMWAYWEHTNATVREALLLQGPGNDKNEVRDAS
jgi:hypothetical protein